MVDLGYRRFNELLEGAMQQRSVSDLMPNGKGRIASGKKLLMIGWCVWP